MPPNFCPNCGIKIKVDDSEYCPKCGIKIGNKSPQTPNPTRTQSPVDSSSHKLPSSGKNGIIKEEEGSKRNWFNITIVLIGFVVVAVVFSYVVLGAGFFTTQKSQETVYKGVEQSTQNSQETVYKGVEQSTANIQMIGNTYGLATTPAAGIDKITFVIGLAPGAPAIDLTKMKIVFSTPSTTPVILTHGATSSNTMFTTKIGATPVTRINANDQVEIYFGIANMGPNTKMNFELRPSVGAALPFSKTAPATIAATNLLY